MRRLLPVLTLTLVCAVGRNRASALADLADVLRQGYTMKGRVIRPAGVKVTRKEARGE